MRQITIDLAAIRDNYALLKQELAPAKVMAVVKADAYGHGMLEVAKTLDSAGVDAIGVADFAEAVALRDAGIHSRVMCWLLGEDVDYAKASELGIELGISTFEQLGNVQPGTKLHIKVDTGLGRPLARILEVPTIAHLGVEVERRLLGRVHVPHLLGGLVRLLRHVSPEALRVRRLV